MTLKPHSRNLRKGRSSERGRYYAVTKCVRGRQPLLDPKVVGIAPARIIADCLRGLEERDRCRCLYFVVMPDHVHFIVQLKADSLSSLVKSFSSFTSKEINAQSGRAGSLWQSGFYDHALRGEGALEGYAAYLRQNPVRAGLVENPDEWAFQGPRLPGQSPPGGGSHRDRVCK
jgi:REP element-mobilizing transposase RayT